MKKQKKIFVIDTNVLLHDYKCIYNFEENDIIIPITVLEELDKFKRGNDIINFQAREFTRELDKISGDQLFNGGLPLGNGMGKLSIETGKPFSEKLKHSFPENTPDHRILAITEFVADKFKDRSVHLITKDINLRMKAKSLGIMAQDYQNDMVLNIDDIYRDVNVIEDASSEAIAKLYKQFEGVPLEEFNIKADTIAHQYFIFKNNNASALAHYDPFNKVINRVGEIENLWD
jgi:PhoH-like ATPase